MDYILSYINIVVEMEEMVISMSDKVDVGGSSGENPVWNVLRKLNILFVTAGIYFSDDKRSKCFDVFAKFYSGLVLFVLIIAISILSVESYLTYTCSSFVVVKVAHIAFRVYALLNYIFWRKVTKATKKRCDQLVAALIHPYSDLIKRLEKMVKVVLVSSCILFLSLVGTCVYTLWMDIKSGINNHSGNLNISSSNSIISAVFTAANIIDPIFRRYAIYSVVLFLSGYGLWCYLLYTIFEKVNSKIASSLLPTATICPSTIERLRLQYEEGLKAVIDADKCFCTYICYSAFYSNVSLCLSIYMFASASDNTWVVYLDLVADIVIWVLIIVPPVVLQNCVSNFLHTNRTLLTTG